MSSPPLQIPIPKEYSEGPIRLRVLGGQVFRELYGRKLWRITYEIEHVTPSGIQKTSPSFLFLLEPEIPEHIKRGKSPPEIQSMYNKMLVDTFVEHASAAIRIYKSIREAYG